MARFQQLAASEAEHQIKPEWLDSLHQAGLQRWQNTPWPRRKAEHWKYTSLRPLEQLDLVPAAERVETRVEPAAVDWADQPHVRLVFVDGQFAADLSSAELPPGVCLFSQADGGQRELIQAHLGQYIEPERHIFAALSNAGVAQGVLVHVPRGQRLEPVVSIEYISTRQPQAGLAQVRCLVILEEGAEASVVEHFHSSQEEQTGFVNALSELVVGANARLRHIRLNLEQEAQLHVGGVHGTLAASGRIQGFALATGSRLKRIDYHLRHQGEGSELVLNGIYLPRRRQMVDYHTTIEHAVPQGTTREAFRGIVADRARAVFNGRIHIHPQAQKTLAELNNRNLLTSTRAEVDTKPELEIYADDVQCAHGATVSQLDPEARHYLQSRGISRARADAMLSFGFVNELLNEVPEPALGNYLRQHLTHWLALDTDDRETA